MPKLQSKFIIWTVRRTGGTRFTNKLTDMSIYPVAQHEPFNIDRMFGRITKKFIDEGDEEVLRKEIKEICNKGYIIKHCIETVPKEISFTLAEESSKAGYKHLFLYRKNGLERLLSLHFAKITNVWGSKLKERLKDYLKIDSKEDLDFEKLVIDKLRNEVLPIDNLAIHEYYCVCGLSSIWYYLQNILNTYPFSISYEDLYLNPNLDFVANKLVNLFNYLEIDSEFTHNEALDFLKELRKEGEQGTKNFYLYFQGIDKLKDKLKEIPWFRPDAYKMYFDKIIERNDIILFANIDTYPEMIEEGNNVSISGVVVLSPEAQGNGKLIYKSPNLEKEITWNIESPFMASKFPHGKNSRHSRFRFEIFVNGEEEGEIILNIDNLNFTVFRIKFLKQEIDIPFPKVEIARLERRKWILNYAPKEGIGAELGVFRGHFSEILIKELRPKKIYFVDLWRKQGKYFSWGKDDPYHCFQWLTTELTYFDAVNRICKYKDSGTNIVIVEDDVKKFLANLEEALDWVYLDTYHQYKDTLEELDLIDRVLKPGGVIVGDDWTSDPSHKHYGVFKAVNEFVKSKPNYVFVAAGPGAQFVIKKVERGF